MKYMCVDVGLLVGLRARGMLGNGNGMGLGFKERGSSQQETATSALKKKPGAASMARCWLTTLLVGFDICNLSVPVTMPTIR